MRNSFLFVRETRLSAVFKAHQVNPIVEPDVLNTSESSRDSLCRSAAKCDAHCELLSIDTSPRVIASQISSAQAILSQEAYGILVLPLHSNRIDCCLSLSCV